MLLKRADFEFCDYLYPMPIIVHKALDEARVLAVWEISETAEELQAALQFNEAEWAYLQAIKNESRRLSWLGCRVLLRQLLNTTDFIHLHADEQGKPFLRHSPYHISLSHSGKYAAVMISKKGLVGIDIELMSDKVKRIASKFLTETELAFIAPEDETKQLYACWCAKEALFKWHGKGNLPFKESLVLQPFTLADKQIATEIRLPSFQQDLMVNFEAVGEYMLAWVG